MLRIKGQSLIEIIVVIAVVGVALVAVTLSATFAIRNSRFARDRSTARNLAFEMLEDVKQAKRADPDAFLGGSTREEILSPTTGTPVFSRKVTYTVDIAGEKMVITAEVTWVDSGRTLSVIEETSLEKYSE